MARYISDEWLREIIQIMNRDACENCTDTDCEECYIDLVDNAPREDVVPVVHGMWIGQYGTYGTNHCTNCHIDYSNDTKFWNYCPNCGAKMDLEGNDG